MKPSIFALAVCKLDEYLARPEFQDDQKTLNGFLKLLEYATMIEAEDEDELPVVVLRGFQEMPKATAKMIVEIRNSKPFSDLSLIQERFVYRMLRKIYQV